MLLLSAACLLSINRFSWVWTVVVAVAVVVGVAVVVEVGLVGAG